MITDSILTKNITDFKYPFFDKILTKDDINNANEEEFILQGTIPVGKITTIYSDANQGKTTFAIAVAMKNDRTIYLDMENPLDVYEPFMLDNKLKIITASNGNTIDDMINVLKNFASNDKTYQDDSHLIIMDTLVHFCDPNDHKEVKNLYELLQQIRNNGHTIIVLHHTNKKEQQESSRVKDFFGNSTIKTQTDTMLYMSSINREDDGKLLVTLYPTKKRGYIDEKSYLIDFMNFGIEPVAESNVAQKHKDKQNIELIQKIISDGATTSTEIIDSMKHLKISKRKTNEILKRYENDLWKKGGTGGKRQWSLIKTTDK